MNKSTYKIVFVLSALVCLSSCKTNEQWKGQGEIEKVNTETVPIQRQCKGIFFLGNGIYSSNNFSGARLNGMSLSRDSVLTALITPENTPINMSPWYAFKVWSDTVKAISLKLTYPEGVKHRYYPKISRDGKSWKSVDSANFKLDNTSIEGQEVPTGATVRLTIPPDTLWISAQEPATDSHVNSWSSKLEEKSFVSKSRIGKSREGRSINAFKIGKNDDKAMVVVLSRQHPPEVTGFKAMQAFVERISTEDSLANAFRSRFNTYVIPVVNPDGVANGHWRHNSGGIDLNRDWEDFNQPETAAIRDFIVEKVNKSGGKIYFFIDFHSTWEDIYYTMNPEEKGNMPGLVPELIELTGEEFKDYEPNVRPSPGTGKRVTSTSYFFYTYGAESLTYEIGDNTPPEFIRKKGEITATKLMQLMTNKKPKNL